MNLFMPKSYPSVGGFGSLKYRDFMAEDQERKAKFQQAWERYEGEFPDSLRALKGETFDDNIKVNYCAQVVDKGVSFLFGKDVEFILDPEQETAEETWLEEVWEASHRSILLKKWATNGGVYGHAFLRMWVDPALPYPRIVNLDPAMVTVLWEPDDIESVFQYTLEWDAPDHGRQVMVQRRQSFVREEDIWVIYEEMRENPNASWTELGRERWPYPFAPIVDCQNLPKPNEFWGKSDLEDSIQRMNISLNFLLSNINRIIRFYAQPLTWGRGFDAASVQRTVDKITVLPTDTGMIENLEMAGDLGSSLEVFKELRAAFHQLARVPEVSTGKLDQIGQLSGLALKILYGPLVEKTEDKQTSYGAALNALNRRLLIVGKGVDTRPTVQWPSLLPADDYNEAQTYVIDHELGVSQKTLMRKRGYDPELEQALRSKEDQNKADLGTALLSQFEKGNQTLP
jgi:hypothetical protein